MADMNQLWAVAVGLLGGIGATLVGGILNERTSRHQIQGQAVTEHQHWLTTLRLDAYGSYISAWDKALVRLRQRWLRAVELEEEESLGDHVDWEQVVDEFFSSMQAEIDEVQPFCETVLMLGPADAATAATKMMEELGKLRDATLAYAGASSTSDCRSLPWREAWEAAQEPAKSARQEFSRMASQRITEFPETSANS